jgi:uncharacterized membrane protein HdeD (DUF308 family)
MLVLRGLAAIVFGLVALAWPSLTALVLAALFGVYALLNGAVRLGGAFRRGHAGIVRGLLVLTGLLGVAAGVVSLLWPGITALVLAVVVGAWAIATGVLEIWIVLRWRPSWLLALVGVLSILAGVLVLGRPDLGAVAIAQVIGVYAVVVGALMLAEAVRLRRVAATPAPASHFG